MRQAELRHWVSRSHQSPKARRWQVYCYSALAIACGVGPRLGTKPFKDPEGSVSPSLQIKLRTATDTASGLVWTRAMWQPESRPQQPREARPGS